MNDFHATPVHWDDFAGIFETEKLGEKFSSLLEAEDHEQMSSVALEFLNQFLWEKADDGFPVTLGFYRLGALAAAYQDARHSVPENVRQGLDELYLPFAGQWLTFDPPRKQKLDLPVPMKMLGYGGLSVAIEPAHCRQIAEGLANSGWREALAKSLHPGSAESTAIVMSETENLLNLITTAVSSGKGVLAVFEM